MRLIILRHSLAEDNLPGESDFLRQLTIAGKQKAFAWGELLQSELEILPSEVFSSNALRAVETLAELQASGLGAPSLVSRDIYDVSSGLPLLEFILNAGPRFSDLLLIGHNPACSDLVSYLTGKPMHLSPCMGAVLESSETVWSQAFQKTWDLVKVLEVKD